MYVGQLNLSVKAGNTLSATLGFSILVGVYATCLGVAIVT